jgi:DNA uptake protein ComE-like DNA-binding protein
MVFFSILSVGIARVVSSQADLLRRVEGWVIGESAMRSACWHIRKEIPLKKEPYDSRADLQRENTVEFGVAAVRYHLVDEESRININTAPLEVLARVPGIGPDLAAKIAASPFRPFFVKESLLWIDGLDDEAFARCRDLVTVYSSGRVNINTAPVAVLDALGMDGALVAAIDAARKGSDGIDGTGDDKVFDDMGRVETMLADLVSLTDVQKEALARMLNTGILGIDADNFTVFASVDVLGRKVMDYEIVLNANRILRWNEY